MSEESYRLSPKGWLTVQLMPKFSMDESEKLWTELTAFVARQAKQNGMPDGGIPCLVLQDGGHCITAESKTK